MAQTLDYNSSVSQVVPITVPSFEGDTEIIQALDDEPNDVGGLTAQELKERFDHVGTALKEYINGDLVPAVLSTGLTEQARQEAEGERVANEIERVNAERERLAAESARAAAETERGLAEAARQAAEALREDTERGYVAQAQTHAQAAQAAREGAEAAGTSAKEARKGAEEARDAAEESAVKAEEWAQTARDLSGGDVATRREAKGYVKAHNADPLAHEGIFPRIGFVAGERARESWRPEYGLGGGGEEGGGKSAVLEVEDHTGRAWLSAIVSGVEYDAVNMETDGDLSGNGTLIVRRLE